MSEAYRKKISVDALLGKLDRLQKKLKINTDGTCGDGIVSDFYINKFNRDGSREKLVERYGELAEEYKSLAEELKKHDSNIDRLEMKIGEESDSGRIAELRKELADEESERADASKRIKAV
jgi:chromosome segregation ATPase